MSTALSSCCESVARFSANSTIDVELQLARVLYARGNYDEARRLHARIEPLLPARFVETAEVRVDHAELGRRLAAAATPD